MLLFWYKDVRFPFDLNVEFVTCLPMVDDVLIRVENLYLEALSEEFKVLLCHSFFLVGLEERDLLNEGY